jgi:hypothetical protein
MSTYKEQNPASFADIFLYNTHPFTKNFKMHSLITKECMLNRITFKIRFLTPLGNKFNDYPKNGVITSLNGMIKYSPFRLKIYSMEMFLEQVITKYT